MYPTLDNSHIQARRVQNRCSQKNYIDVFNAITCDALLPVVESLLPEHRERLFPPTETLAMFVSQALSQDSSCQNIVNQSAVQRLVGGLPNCSTHTGGYCRARQRLPVEMVQALTHHLGHLMHQGSAADWRWRQRQVRLIDGTTITMPDTSANQSVFPQQSGQAAGLGFPICRLVGVTCLSSGALLDAAIGPFKGKGCDERNLLRSLQETFDSGDILLGDAYFSTYFFMADMQARKIDLLMEQNGARKRVTDFRRGQRLGERDHLIQLKKPRLKPEWMTEAQYQSAPDTITIREFKTGGKILITTLTSPKTYPKAELKTLYRMRWSVELDLRSIKDTMGMGVLSCKTPAMAIKEIWICLLAYNLIRYLMVQSALLCEVVPRNLSFKHALQLWLVVNQEIDQLDATQYQSLLQLLSQQRVGNRPGRVEPRAVKRRSKPYPLLMQSRATARQQVLENGHPKKLK
jgi:hypothetical protein